MLRRLSLVLSFYFTSNNASAQTWGQAENWTAMINVPNEGTGDGGGRLNVGCIHLNDWMDYSHTANYILRLGNATLTTAQLQAELLIEQNRQQYPSKCCSIPERAKFGHYGNPSAGIAKFKNCFYAIRY